MDQITPGMAHLLAQYRSCFRAEVFATCPRLELPVVAGEATLLHRLTIHGVAPWSGEGRRPRLIVYFRPLMLSVANWLAA